MLDYAWLGIVVQFIDEDRKKVEKILKDCNIKAEIKDSALKGDL